MARAGKRKPGKTRAKPRPKSRTKAKPRPKPKKARKPAIRAKKKPALRIRKKKPAPNARPRAKAVPRKPKARMPKKPEPAPTGAKPAPTPEMVLLPKPAPTEPAAMIPGPTEEKHEEARPEAEEARKTGEVPSWMKKKIARPQGKEEKPEEELTPEEKIERLFPEEKTEKKEEREAEGVSGEKEEKHGKEEEGIKPEEPEQEGALEEEEAPEKEPKGEKAGEAEKAPEEEHAEKAEEKPEEAPEGKPEEHEEKPGELAEEKPEEKELPEAEALPEEAVEKAAELPAEEKPEAGERPKIVPPRSEPLAKSVIPGEAVPAFEILPEWEDRRRLRRVVEEGSITLSVLRAGSRDMKEALRLIAKKGEAMQGAPGYSMICAKDRSGKIVGASDFCVIRGGGVALLALMHLAVFTMDKKRDMLMVLYAAALGASKPTHVMCRIPKPDLGKADDVGRLIFFGRGLGMSALPLNHPRMLYFIRRINKEHDPVMFGQQIALIVGMSEPAYNDKTASSLSAKLSDKGGIPLIMLPLSPDYGEHLHELKDAVLALGLSTAQLDSAFPALETQYLKGRADITPAALL